MAGRLIRTNIHRHPRFRALSGKARHLWLTLVTHPHSNLTGIFQVDLHGWADLTGLTKREVRDAMEDLRGLGWMVLEGEEAWLPGFTEHQAHSPTTWRGAAKCLDDVYSQRILSGYAERYPDVWEHASEAVRARLTAVQADTLPIPSLEGIENIHNPDTDPDTDSVSDRGDARGGQTPGAQLVPETPPDVASAVQAMTEEGLTLPVDRDPHRNLAPYARHCVGLPPGLQVLAAWCLLTGRDPRRHSWRYAKRRSKCRRRAVEERLAEGYTVRDLVAAIRGNLLSPHHQGVNERGTVYDGLSLIARSGEALESFRDIAEGRGLNGQGLAVAMDPRSVSNRLASDEAMRRYQEAKDREAQADHQTDGDHR